MNDELRGQLTSHWIIPQYARDALWIETAHEIVQTEGEHGLFELTTPARELTLRWCGADGPALACLPWQPDTLEWDGMIALGGYLDAMHIAQLPGLDVTINLLYLGGHPLKPGVLPYIPHAQRQRVPYPIPEFHTGLASSIPESISTWLVAEDSALSTAAHAALVNNLRLYLFGRLCDERSGWGEHFALPIVLESATLFTT